MIKTIREGLFETNSSAVHSLAIAGKLDPPNLATQDGYTLVWFEDFDNYGTIYTQQGKLNYLVSQLYYQKNCYYSNAMEDLVKSYDWTILEEVICKQNGTKGIRFSKDSQKCPNINHQAQGEEIINIWDEDLLKDFIFNPNVGIKIWHD